jgi:hypothetical protein
LCEPATKFRVEARLTGSTGIQKLIVLAALDIVIGLVLVPGRRLQCAGFLGQHVVVIEPRG